MAKGSKTVFAQFTKLLSIHNNFYKWKMKDAQLAIRCLIAITVRDSTVLLKGSHRMGDGWIFSKNLRASLFNDDPSNEPNFGRIHLAGQNL